MLTALLHRIDEVDLSIAKFGIARIWRADAVLALNRLAVIDLDANTWLNQNPGRYGHQELLPSFALNFLDGDVAQELTGIRPQLNRNKADFLLLLVCSFLLHAFRPRALFFLGNCGSTCERRQGHECAAAAPSDQSSFQNTLHRNVLNRACMKLSRCSEAFRYQPQDPLQHSIRQTMVRHRIWARGWPICNATVRQDSNLNILPIVACAGGGGVNPVIP